VEKSSEKCQQLLQKFSKYLPKVNNRPLGKNSPNLVTLAWIIRYGGSHCAGGAGGPDLANFRLLSDCQLWAVS
jgi:hypothetical protein